MGKPSRIAQTGRQLRLRLASSSTVKAPSSSSSSSASSAASRKHQTCTSCGFSTRHRVLFDRHAKRCQNGLCPPQVVARNYKCKKCKFTTIKSKMFLYHLKDKHGEGINIFPCDLCEYASRYKCKVLRHRKFVHRAAKPIEADDLSEDRDNDMDPNTPVLTPGGDQGDEDQGLDGIHEMEQDDLSDVEILDNMEGAAAAVLSDGDNDSQGIQLSVPSIRSPIKSTDNAFDYIRRLSDSPESHQPAYQCALCTYSNVQKWKVANHVRSYHMKKKVFKCSFCSFVTSRKIEFCIHKTQHSDKKVWSCQDCEYKSISRTNFDRHLSNHEADLPVKCTFCSYSSTGEAAVQRHITECHPQEAAPEEEEEEEHSSELGSNNNNNNEPLEKLEKPMEHLSPMKRLTHENPSEITCRVCGLKVKNESKLRIHMVSHSTESVHWCPLCTLKYKRSSDLNRHMKRKHGARLRDFFFMGQQEQPLNLSVTKQESGFVTGMMAGSSSVSNGSESQVSGGEDAPLDLSLPKDVIQMTENLKCSHCSYLAKWPSDLRRHLLVHSVEKRYKCPCCHRKYKYQFDLNMHLRRMHRVPAGRTKVSSTSSGPPVVNIANLDSSSVTLASSADENSAVENNNNNIQGPPVKVHRYKLTRQQVSPQGKYKCDYCPYLGKYQSEVDRHMRLHTGDKPYSCLFCSYRSHWRGDMKRHLQKHHSQEEGVADDIAGVMERTYQPDLPAEPEVPAPSAEDQAPGEDNEESTETPMEIQEDNTENKSTSGRGTPSGDTGSDGMEFINLTPSSTSSTSVSTPCKPGERRPNMCPYCPFTCEAPSKLKCHMEIHENLKRFKCAHCGKRSNWTWDVRKHIKKEHPGLELSVIVMEEDEARETLPGYLQTHYKVLPKKELPDKNELPTQVPLNRITDQLPPVDILGVLAPLQMGNLSDGSYQDEEDMSDHSSVLPFSSPPQPKHHSIATKRCRPFKCSKCGRRSNWKWDMNKHIRNVHPQAKLIVLSPEVARATMPKGGFKNANMGRKENFVSCEVVKPEVIPPPSSSKSKHNHQFDSNRTKKFKCSACPYRSDYRSDIGRHLKRLHKPGSATIMMLSDEEARSTLQQYKERWVRGKFVFSPAKEKMYEEFDRQNAARKSLNTVFGEQSHSDTAHSEDASYAGSELNWAESGSETPSFRQENEEEAQAGPAAERGRKWKCPKCTYTHPNKKMVVRHMRQHPKAKVFQCRLCREASDYRNSMYRHVRNKHNSTDYSGVVHESIAYVTTVVKSESELNADSEDTPVTYRCKLCSQTSCWKSGIMRHVAESHSKESDAAENVEVLQVSSITPALPQQVTQEGVICEDTPVTDIKLLKCETCPYKTNKSGLLKIHRTYHRPQPGNKYKCRFCPYYVSAMRLLHQHIRLHTHSQPIETNNSIGTRIVKRERVVEPRGRDEEEDEEEPMGLDLSTHGSDILASPGSKSAACSTQSSPGRRYYCDQCPAVSRNKNDFLYHKQFHRPKPSSPFKCKLCNYWVSQRRLLRQHERVHLTEYIEHYHNNNNNCPKPEVLKTYADRGVSIPQMVLASPAKSDISDYDDPIQIAKLKQQIIASKITPTPITPDKFKESDRGAQEPFTTEGYMVNPSGQLLKSGSLRKLHQCRFCPYTNIRATVLRMHETMHGAKPGKDLLKCPYCDYHVGNKGLLSHHMKVHSSTYAPGHEEINDAYDSDTRKGEEEKQKKAAEEAASSGTDKQQQQSAPPVVPATKSDVLDLSCMPPNSEYYVKFNPGDREHMLERASFKKWCCEKCPYATMKRAQFERHVSLHGSRQKYICEFCDYSVPAYHLLLQHKKLHLAPNPNLLTAQSITNLQRLPPIAADVAAAANFPASASDPASVQGHQDGAQLFENTTEFTEPKKLYRCDRCPYQNIRRDHLLSHLKFHMVQSDLKCHYCDYSVSKQHLLVQHIKVHFSGPGSEGFLGPNNALNLSFGKATNKDEAAKGPQVRKGDKTQPEYIDITELGGSSLLAAESAAKVDGEKSKEDDGKTLGESKAKTETDSHVTEERMEVDTAENEAVEEVKEQESKEVSGKAGEENTSSEQDGDGSCVCEYCDRDFDTREQLKQHERQHLIGNK